MITSGKETETKCVDPEYCSFSSPNLSRERVIGGRLQKDNASHACKNALVICGMGEKTARPLGKPNCRSALCDKRLRAELNAVRETVR